MTSSADSFTVALGPSLVGVRGGLFALADPESLLPPFIVDDQADFAAVVVAGDAPLGSWRISRVEDVRVENGGALVRMRLTEWDAVFDLERRVVEADLRGPWYGALDSLFKTLVQLVALNDGTGALFHAAAVVMDGRGYLFIGPSGAGKTTVADLSEGAGGRVLSEEIACVGGFHEQAGLQLVSVPLRHRRRRVVTPCKVPLAGVFTLVQDDRDAVTRLARGEAFKALLRCVTTGVRHERFLRLAFVLMDEMVDRVPVYELRFRKSADFWSTIRESMAAAPRSGVRAEAAESGT